MTHYLIMEKNFTPDGADRFIKSFRATMNTAGLTGDSKLTGNGNLLETDDDFEENEEDHLPTETPRLRALSSSTAVAPEGFMTLPVPLDPKRIVTVIMPIEMNEADWKRFDRVLEGYRPLSPE